jgi:hypothetical protein
MKNAGGECGYAVFQARSLAAALLAVAIGVGRGLGKLGDFLCAPELDERLVGHIELAGVIADGVQNVFRHAQ